MNTGSRVRIGVFFLLAAATAPRLAAATFTVTTVDDGGPGSLRQAIADANFFLGNDTIAFNIIGSGVHTLALAFPLPPITDPVIIDGYTQPGSSPNTRPTGEGLDTHLQIAIDGSGAGIGACLTVNAGNTGLLAMAIWGLNINGCQTAAILVGAGGNGAVIGGNFIGTDPTGTFQDRSQNIGVWIIGATDVQVGGAAPFDRNLLSGSRTGVAVNPGPNTAVLGNLIGTNAAGDAPIAFDTDFGTGIAVSSGGANVTIGGPIASHRNVISGNSGAGISLSYGTLGRTIQGNYIGTDATGTHPVGNKTGLQLQAEGSAVVGNVIAASAEHGILVEAPNIVVQGNFIGTDESAALDLGNGGAGVYINAHLCTVGGTAPSEGNVIAHNGRLLRFGGVAGWGEMGRIRGNRTFDNRPLGIDLLDFTDFPYTGVTPNDPGDADTGANGFQNYPMITSVVSGASTTHIEGLLNSTASTSFDVDLYAISTPACRPRPQDYVQGESYLGSTPVITDGSGNATFAADVPFVLEPGQPVTATATDPLGNTSEFSQRIIFSVVPPSGPAEGGTTATLNGMLFEVGATVTVGGVPATDVLVQGSTSIAATMPSRPPGSPSDVTVLDPSGVAGTLRNGWMADFLDVPSLHLFHDFVTTLVANGITAGCGGGNYCPSGSVTRAQMAVFLLRGKNGHCYLPPPATGTVFDDVPSGSFAAAWIEQLSALGITAGCGGSNYCPGATVTREQMAVFLLRTLEGSGYAPPACTTATFADVPCSNAFAPWIEQLAARGITGGCGGNNYCPFSPNTRGQMAVFITNTFLLP